jgi:hypothetical protein
VLPAEKTTVSLSQTERFCGTYSVGVGLTFKVSSCDGNLLLHYEQQSPVQTFATSELEFFAKAVNTSVSFEKDKMGNITAMTLAQAGVMSLGSVDQQIRAEKQV